MKKILSIIAAVALMGTLVSGCTKEEKEALEKTGLNLAKGEAFDIDYNMDMNFTIAAQGLEMKMPIKMDGGTLLEVQSVDGEEFNFGYSFKRQKMSMDFIGQSINIDTESNTPESQQFKEMLDKMKLSIVTDKYGKVKSSQLPEEFGGEQQIADLIETQKIELEQIIGFIPSDVEIKVGAEWEKEKTQKQNETPIKYKEKFKISKIENDKIYVESTITSNGKIEQLGDVEISGNGTYVINKNSLPESVNYVILMDAKDADLGNGSKASMNLKMEYKCKITKR